MCNLILGIRHVEREFLLPSPLALVAAEQVLLRLATTGWPTDKPVTLDFWAPEPPLVVHGADLSYATIVRCEEHVKK